TFHDRWVAQLKSRAASASERTGVAVVVTASPYGFSAEIGTAPESTSITELASPSTSRSSRATRKCWWNGAYVRSSTTVPVLGGPASSAYGVATISPVARTSP